MPFLENDMPLPKEDMPFMEDDMHRPRPDKMPEMREKRGPKPPSMFKEHDIVIFIILLLMFGMNLGLKYYFRHRQDRERLIALERQNLEQQLEYLKYQINPHFLMNTLNNIHALVDIDPEQAKETIVELSKIMRFVLYEGSKQKVPLRQELIFLDNYIQLMRMRITDNKVDINVDIPQAIPDREIPPLMMITFVENAFKHGVSYQQHSFIHINIQIIDNQLHFVCSNSKVPQGEDHHGGLGLQNAKRRLELIYGRTYHLDIRDEENTYTVNLTLPL
jgi:LytS/YehU family sensor histidine kinase